MNPQSREELLGQLYDQTLVGNGPAVLELTNAGLEMGLGPEELLYEALIPSLEEVGARFERGDFFVPEMLIAGKAMAGALEILRPLLAETGAQTIGTIVMGTVRGDVHDIGKWATAWCTIWPGWAGGIWCWRIRGRCRTRAGRPGTRRTSSSRSSTPR
jgi:methanogenic corrinoid protein MtbC1